MKKHLVVVLLFSSFLFSASDLFGETNSDSLSIELKPNPIGLKYNADVDYFSQNHAGSAKLDFEDFFETSELLEYGASWIRLQYGLGSTLKLEKGTYKYGLPPVSVQFEKALNWNITTSFGVAAQFVNLNDIPVKYQYYNVFLGAHYHINLEPLIDIEGLLPYFGFSFAYRMAFMNGFEGEYKERNGLLSADLQVGLKYSFEKFGFLFEYGSSDTACMRFGFFFAVSEYKGIIFLNINHYLK